MKWVKIHNFKSFFIETCKNNFKTSFAQIISRSASRNVDAKVDSGGRLNSVIWVSIVYLNISADTSGSKYLIMHTDIFTNKYLVKHKIKFKIFYANKKWYVFILWCAFLISIHNSMQNPIYQLQWNGHCAENISRYWEILK